MARATISYDTDSDAKYEEIDETPDAAPETAEPEGRVPFPDAHLPSPTLSNADLRYMLRVAEDFLAPLGYRAKAIRVEGVRVLLLSGPAGRVLVESVHDLLGYVAITNRR